MSLAGADTTAQLTAVATLPGKINYLGGSDASKWQTNVATYSTLQAKNVYPGIDISYTGDQHQLEYTFTVAAGADATKISLKFDGQTKLALASGGDLVITSGTEELWYKPPQVYQNIGGTKQTVTASYLIKANNQVGFTISSYDHSQPLIIDPVFNYSTYIGSGGDDEGHAIAVDANGNAYVTGFVSDTDYPTTLGAYNLTYSGNNDVFVTKLNPTGTALVYSTYLGGSGDDNGEGIAVDSSGNAYLTGYTTSSNFPTTSGAKQTTKGSGKDGFVTKLNSTGTGLVYSTFLGGSGTDDSRAIAVDSSGNAYVAGYTTSTNFPVTTGAYQTTLKGSSDAFVTKVNASGSNWVYSTYLGGTGSVTDEAWGIAVDSSGNAYVAGYAESTNFPTTTGAYNTTAHGGDGFVTKLNTSGTGLVYSTFVGGSGGIHNYAIAVDSSGKAYVTGSASFDGALPTTSGAYQATSPGTEEDGFVVKLNASGSGVDYASYLRGSGVDYGSAIAVDPSGNVYLTGYTESTDFPVTSSAFQSTNGTVGNMFITKLSTTGGGLVYSTYLGGTNTFDQGYGIALDSSRNIYVAGKAAANDFPTTSGAYQPNKTGGLADVVVVKFSLTSLNFTTQPAGASAGGAFSTQPVITVKNPDGTTDTSFNGAVSIAIKSGTGASGAVLSGTTTVNAVNGVATFSGLAINTAGTGYVLTVSSGLLDRADSAAFNVGTATVTATVIVADSGSGQDATVNAAFATALKAKVLDTNGSGVDGVTVTFTTPTSGASAGCSPASVTTIGGGFAATSCSANSTTGRYNVVATVSGIANPATFGLRNTPTGTAKVGSIGAADGSGQSATVNTQFNKQLKIVVRDGDGNIINGSSLLSAVSFTVPGSGASASCTTPNTDTSGAIVTTCSANGTVGSYGVIATISGFAGSAVFALNNIAINSQAIVSATLNLTPLVSGPNPISATQKITATFKDRDGNPINGASVTFTVSGANPQTSSAISTVSGSAVFTYTGTITGTDTITATATYNSLTFQATAPAKVEWISMSNKYNTSPVLGRFYIPEIETKNLTATATPVFTQTFPTLIFNPPNGSVTGNTSGIWQSTSNPFTNISTDANGNFNGYTVAQGNGYVAGRDGNGYTGAYSGFLTIKDAGSLTFKIYNFDNMLFGIGPNSLGQQPQVTSSTNSNCSGFPSNTPLTNLPVMVCQPFWEWLILTVNFPAPGVYPFEYVGSEDTNGDGSSGLYIYDSGDKAVGPVVSVGLNPTNPVSTQTVGQTTTFTITVKDNAGVPVANQKVSLNIVGANLQQIYTQTNTLGQVAVPYTGSNAGTDTVRAVAFVKGMPSLSSEVTVNWAMPSGGVTGCTNVTVTNWLANPSSQSTVSTPTQITLATGVTLRKAKVQYWPVANPSAITTLATNLSGSPSPLATLDTTTMANDAYIIQLLDTDTNGNDCKASLNMVTVAGEYKPGRVNFTVTDFTVPVAGLPISVGRTYDSLERNNPGDFGYGWSLALGAPRLTVNANTKDVTVQLPDGRRSTFYFAPQGTSIWTPFLMTPSYQAEAGVYGSLSGSDGDWCGALVASGTQYLCFPGGPYNPATYTYTDPYGRAFVMDAVSGKLKSIRDLNGNTLTFDSTGITSSAGNLKVQFGRDTSGRITVITDTMGVNYNYAYDGNGDLYTVTFPPDASANRPVISYTYETTGILKHLFKTASSSEPTVTRPVVTGYDITSGRLMTVTQPIDGTAANDYVTSYSYDTINRITFVTNPDGGKTAMQYDSYGKVISQTDQIDANHSRTTNYTYDSKHNLTQTTLPKPSDGTPDPTRLITYEYDGNGNQTVITNTVNYANRTTYNQYGGPTLMTAAPTSLFTQGITRTVGYDSNFLPTNVSDALGSMGGYSFDSRGSILTRSDGNGKITSFTYDNYGNKTAETDPTGATTRFSYDTMGRMLTSTDPFGNVTQYQYDAIGQLITLTDSLNNKTIYGYDKAGRKTSEKDANGKVTTYTYDFAGRVIRTDYPDSSFTLASYDWRGNVTTATDQSNRQTISRYDLAGQLTSVTYANGTTDAATVSYFYDSAGRKIKETNAVSGSSPPASSAVGISYTYDYADRMTSMTNQLGKVTNYAYYEDGKLKQVTDANNHNTTSSYNVRGQLTSTTFVEANTTIQQGYDGAGNLITKTDQLLHSTLYQYDAANRLIQVSIPITQSASNYQVTQYLYDARGQLKLITDANANKTSFEYDALGRQTYKIWPDGSFEMMGYDTVGNITSQQKADNKVNSFQFDALNRLKQASFFDNRTVVYTYTLTGLRSQVNDSTSGITQYGYDNRDRVTLITQPNGNSVGYGYDARNNRTSLVTTIGGTASTTSYTFDDASQLATVKAPYETTASQYSYDPVGLRSGLSLPNGINITYGYNSVNQLNSVTQKLGSTTLASYNYSLDPVGNKTAVNENGVANVYQWQYDDAYRLLSETYGGVTTTWSYYGTGNRKTQKVGSNPQVSYTYNQLDQLVSDGTNKYAYDARGNLVQVSGGTSYQFDAADRMTGATVPGGSAVYGYDADGHRVKQTIGSTVTNYLWDEQTAYGDVIIETDGSNAVQAQYTTGHACPICDVSGLLSQKRGSTVSYYLKDGQGSVRALANASGTITDQYRYDAYGNLQNSTGTTANVYRYTGQQFDTLTGLYDLRARYYNPSVGKFNSRDTYPVNFIKPIEFNRYIYTANNSINNGDPSGLTAFFESSLSQSEARKQLDNVNRFRSGEDVDPQGLAADLLNRLIYGATNDVLLASVALYVNIISRAKDSKGYEGDFSKFTLAVGIVTDLQTFATRIVVGLNSPNLDRANQLAHSLGLTYFGLLNEIRNSVIGVTDFILLQTPPGRYFRRPHAEQVIANWAINKFNDKTHRVLAIGATRWVCQVCREDAFNYFRQTYPILFKYTVVEGLIRGGYPNDLP